MSFRIVSITVTLLVSLNIHIPGQDLGAYSDYTGNFFIFDQGKSIRVENYNVESFKIGGEYVLYKNSSGNLMMYYKGNKTMLLKSGVTDYFATDCLAGYSIFSNLEIIWNGKVYDASYRFTSFQAQDSLVSFYDKNKEMLRVFYNGKIYDLESGLIGFPISKWASGDNTVAYVAGNSKDFKIWYQGQSFTVIKNVSNVKFKAGRDIVAYTDESDKSFRVFYKGNTFELESFEPQSFKVGDGFVAYVSTTGDFKYFDGGDVITISSFAPTDYFTEDNLLAYIQDGYFYAWYNNQPFEIEAFVPAVYKMDWNTIAYIDNTGRFWLYRDGEKKYLTNELANSYTLVRDMILMNVKVNRNLIYYKGAFIEGEKMIN
jgi:hypothetical protein